MWKNALKPLSEGWPGDKSDDNKEVRLRARRINVPSLGGWKWSPEVQPTNELTIGWHDLLRIIISTYCDGQARHAWDRIRSGHAAPRGVRLRRQLRGCRPAGRLMRAERLPLEKLP